MRWDRALTEAAVAAAVSATAGLVFNAARPGPLPLVARAPYRVLVPCPEPGGPVEPMAHDSPQLMDDRSFLVDARPLADFEARHLPGAVHLGYDWLDPVPDRLLRELAESIASSGAARVVVYGDGGRPDSGEHLGREISGRGIKNVFFIEGGAPALFDGGGP